MYYDRERYEKLIIQSSLFSLDKEIDESAYKREALKMVEYLYCYLLGINEQKYEPYGYEITVVAKRCINGFKGEKGEFLHYFNAAWKQKIKHIYSDQLHENSARFSSGALIRIEPTQMEKEFLVYQLAIGGLKSASTPVLCNTDIRTASYLAELFDNEKNGAFRCMCLNWSTAF